MKGMVIAVTRYLNTVELDLEIELEDGPEDVMDTVEVTTTMDLELGTKVDVEGYAQTAINDDGIVVHVGSFWKIVSIYCDEEDDE